MEALKEPLIPEIKKYCDICGDPIEARMNGQIYEYRCSCRRKEQARFIAERMRDRGITYPLFQRMRFENDKGYDKKTSIKAQKYVDHFQEELEENIGLLFYGGVGTGKTFYAGCIANALIDKGYSAIIINPGTITSLDPRSEEDKRTLKDIIRADLVIFDDLGSERNTEYATERIFTTLNNRISSDKPIICTTNKEPQEMAGEDMPIEQKRIYDRILGVTVPVCVNNTSAREKQKVEKYERLNALFNL